MHQKTVTIKNLPLFVKYHLKHKPYKEPTPDKDLNVVSLGLNPKEFYEKLEKFKDKFEINTLIDLKYKEQVFPIYEININKSAEDRLLILSGTHGNEQAGILCILDLLEDIEYNPEFYSHLNIKIVVPHNPAGARYFSRVNGEGIDINRDFIKKESKEARILMEVIDEFKPKYSISLHEGPQENTFIYMNKLVEEALATKIVEDAKNKCVKFAKKNYLGQKTRIDGYFPVTGYSFVLNVLWSKILKLQPFGYYTYSKGIKNFTIETPWQNPSRKERVSAQIDIIKSVVNSLNIVADIILL